MMKMLTLTNVMTLTVHLKTLRVRSYKDTKFLCPYWKTLHIVHAERKWVFAHEVRTLLCWQQSYFVFFLMIFKLSSLIQITNINQLCINHFVR